ncbi:MAG: HEPN domain-containing protein [Nitrospirae bacterium]|nr:HEPN domain-containing protein [Nitrospirota bacterium]
MTNHEIWRNLFSHGEDMIRTVETAHADAKWALAVRWAQESLELLLKGVLRFLGIETPKTHDPGKVIRSCPARFSGWSREEMDFVCDLSAFLREYRELSFCGDEDRHLPPQEIITREMARRAVDGLKRAHALCLRILPSRPA